MTNYIAYNSALSATTAIAAGTSYATGAKIALQLGIPSGGQIEIVQWGISMDASAAATGVLVEIASTATASTCSTAHSTTTVKPVQDPNGAASRLTMGTTSTGYGNGAITSNTTLRMADRRYVPPTGSLDLMIPLGLYPKFGATGAAEYVQFRINTTATVNAICYMVWNELI
jgi:hypothetical protein